MTTIRNKRAGRKNQAILAKRLGVENVGTLGGEDGRGGNYPDFSWEFKKKKKFVGRTFMAQAVKNCPDGKTPVVIVHETGQRRDEDLVMIRLKDFEEWYGRINGSNS